MKIDERILQNIEKETNALFQETFTAWKKANGDDLFVDDTTYNAITEHIRNETYDTTLNIRIRRTLYKLKCVQDMRELEPKKKYLMFKDKSEYVYNCYKTYFLSEALFKKRITTRKILRLFAKIKIDINLTGEQLTEFINNLLEV